MQLNVDKQQLGCFSDVQYFGWDIRQFHNDDFYTVCVHACTCMCVQGMCVCMHVC